MTKNLFTIQPSNMFRKNIFNLGGDHMGQVAERGEKGAMVTGALAGGLLAKGVSVAGGGSPQVALSDKAKDGNIATIKTAEDFRQERKRP